MKKNNITCNNTRKRVSLELLGVKEDIPYNTAFTYSNQEQSSVQANVIHYKMPHVMKCLTVVEKRPANRCYT